MRAPPRSPDPITEERRWTFTKAGYVLFACGLALSGVVWWSDWPARMYGFPAVLCVVGGWLADANKTRDFFRWLARTFRVPFLRANGKNGNGVGGP